MDGVTLYMLILAAVFVPLSAFLAFMVHRERLRDEAEEAERASGTPAE
jgi:hypothetical protein